jgi:hypothetical protein
MRPLLLLGALTLTACYQSGATTCLQEDEALVRLFGLVRDRETLEPIVGASVFVEQCGLNSVNPNPAFGHPNYRFGTLSANDGTFELTVPRGRVGVHAMLPGFQCGSIEHLDTGAGSRSVIEMSPYQSRDGGPRVVDLVFSPRQVGPGSQVEVSATVRGTRADPISEQVLLLNAKAGTAIALAPPRRGSQAKGFPDGRWHATFVAPKVVGSHVYELVATSQFRCESTQTPIRATLIVEEL